MAPHAQPIWLASYPRSGNTLLRTILHHAFGLKTGSIYGDEMRHNPAWQERVGQLRPDVGGRFDFGSAPALLKTHELPREGPAIYLVRDGREVCVSFWHYCNQLGLHQGISLRQIIEGQTRFGSWSAHVESWQPQQRPETLLLQYEQMVSNLPAVVEHLSSFLNRPPVASRTPSFSEMKQIDATFFRAGTNRTWEQEMGEADLEIFWQLHGQTMVRYGYATPSSDESASSAIPK